MPSDKSGDLFKAIQAGTLKVNQRNANAVKMAYCDSIFWNQTFKDAGLDDLPDPDGLSLYPQVFEDWLVKAYRENFNSEDEVRAALHWVRDQVLKECS
jgi:hypothetical protein